MTNRFGSKEIKHQAKAFGKHVVSPRVFGEERVGECKERQGVIEVRRGDYKSKSLI